MLDQNLLAEFKSIVKDKYATLISFYIEDSQKYIDTILKEIADGNLDKAVFAAHTLKSSSRQVGAIELGAMADHIEKTCRNGTADPDLSQKAEELQKNFTKVIAALKSTL
jgi:HPt (histidine-containing phosphotransfer) domain-containing protein